jgi:HPt (histidine-containing phosphotransfer) domain-containing protein
VSSPAITERRHERVTDGPDVLDGAALERLKALGGPEPLAQMIDLFLEHGAERVRAALAGEQSGDRVALERAAHSLKSTAGNLGAEALQRCAQAIELMAASADERALAGRMRELEARFAEARSALEEQRRMLPT